MSHEKAEASNLHQSFKYCFMTMFKIEADIANNSYMTIFL